MNKIPPFLVVPEERNVLHDKPKKNSLPFIDRTLKNTGKFIKAGYTQHYTARKHGFLQQRHANIKLIFLLYYILLTISSHTLTGQIGYAILLFMLTLFAGPELFFIYKRVFFLSFFFGLVIIAPASLNLITPGKIILPLYHSGGDYYFWIYHFPAEIGITREGILVTAKFFLKVMNSVTITSLVVFTTPFNELIKSLKMLKVPDLFLMVITLTYKYIFILSQTTEKMYFALKSKWWRMTGKTQAEEIIAGRIVYLFRKSWIKYEEIYNAMIARGFHGTADLCYLKKPGIADWIFLAAFTLAGALCYLFNFAGL